MFASLVFKVLARRLFQPFFVALHKLSLAGMNYGGGGSVLGSGEENVLLLLKSRLHGKTPIIFDVGANVGEYALVCQSIIPETKIYCFEPSLSAFKVLRKNLQDHENISLLNIGLSDSAKKMNLFSNKKGSGFGSVYQRRLDHIGLKLTHKETIRLKTLQDVCKENKVRQIDLLKLDVEGHEYSVLRGSRKMLEAGKIGMIQFEFGGCNIDSRTFFQDFFYLLHPKYDIFRVLQDGLFPISNYRELDEVFVTTNYVAILRDNN